MDIVIIGASGFGKMVLDISEQTPLKVAGFIDDDKTLHNKIIDGVSVLGGFGLLPRLIENHNIEGAIVTIGNNKIRAEFFEKLKGMGLRLVNIIHPSAVISKNAKIGDGVIIQEAAVISANTKIGSNVIIGIGATISHDSVIEDHTHVAPGAHLAGSVTVKKYADVGIGVSVIQNITIGENATVGAGAAVIRDVPDNTVVVGVPARVIRSEE